MINDHFITLVMCIIALVGALMTENFQLMPVSLLGLTFLVFSIERVCIGRSLSFTETTLPSFFLLSYILILVVPMTVLFNSIESDAKNLYFSALLVTLIVFPLGVLAANLISGHKHFSGFNYLRTISRDRSFELSYWLFLIVAFVIIILFFIFSQHVQLIDLIMQNSDNDVESQRFAQAELPKSLQYFFEIARRILLPMCVLYAYFMRHLYKGEWNLLFYATFIVALFVSLLTLDRSPVLGLFAMLGLAYFVANRRTGNLRWSSLAIVIVIALLLSGVVSVFQYQTESIDLGQVIDIAWYVLTYRIFESPIQMALYVFETYNYDTYFLNGDYVRLFSILPGIEYSESMSNVAPPFSVGPVTFVGDLWRNWGWIGVVSGAFSFGFIFQVIQIMIFRKLTVARATVYVLLLLGSLTILHGKALGVMTLSVIFLGAILGVLILQIENRK